MSLSIEKKASQHGLIEIKPEDVGASLISSADKIDAKKLFEPYTTGEVSERLKKNLSLFERWVWKHRLESNIWGILARFFVRTSPSIEKKLKQLRQVQFHENFQHKA